MVSKQKEVLKYDFVVAVLKLNDYNLNSSDELCWKSLLK